MNDKELADALVRDGLAVKKHYTEGEFYALSYVDKLLDADELVNDWRVAGKCLERWPTIINTEQLDCTLDEMLRNPRAIIEAYVMALEK